LKENQAAACLSWRRPSFARGSHRHRRFRRSILNRKSGTWFTRLSPDQTFRSAESAPSRRPKTGTYGSQRTRECFALTEFASRYSTCCRRPAPVSCWPHATAAFGWFTIPAGSAACSMGKSRPSRLRNFDEPTHWPRTRMARSWRPRARRPCFCRRTGQPVLTVNALPGPC